MQETSSNNCAWPEPLPLEEVPLLPWPENSFPLHSRCLLRSSLVRRKRL